MYRRILVRCHHCIINSFFCYIITADNLWALAMPNIRARGFFNISFLLKLNASPVQSADHRTEGQLKFHEQQQQPELDAVGPSKGGELGSLPHPGGHHERGHERLYGSAIMFLTNAGEVCFFNVLKVVLFK